VFRRATACSVKARWLGAGHARWLVVVVVTAAACRHDVRASASAERASHAPREKPAAEPAPLPSIRAPGRVVAIGDLHGDLAAARRALLTAKVIDATDRWIGGDSVVVQTGDLLDRGDEERPLLEWLDRLAGLAAAAGGAIYRVQGNHEVMNVAADFRYVTEAGFAAFADYTRAPGANRWREVPEERRGRLLAFLPGGPWAKRLADHPAILLVNDSVFVHGGLLPMHLRYGLARLNAELSAWMRGTAPSSPLLASDEAPYWDRTYGDAVTEAECRALDAILARLSAKRLVIGHTPQKGGISFACGGRVARIDVGLSRAFGSRPAQVLEISGDTVHVLTEAAAPTRAARRAPNRRAAAAP
jgi:hypothetical protein